MLVVDASVAIKWFSVEHDSPVAELVPLRDSLTAPELLVAELCNVSWKLHRRGLLAAGQVDAIPSAIPRYVSALHALRALAPRAVAIARTLDHPAYDCFYLALAERERAEVVTADKRLLARVAGTPWAAHVRDLATFAPSADPAP
jgi:predicted nucleic acid-binding protein